MKTVTSTTFLSTDPVMLCQSLTLMSVGKCAMSQISPAAGLNRILYTKSWQVLLPPKMTRLLIYFLLLCFLSRTPSSIPSYPKCVSISFPSQDPSPQPSLPQFSTLEKSSAPWVIIWFLSGSGHFSALVLLTELRGHCSIQNRLWTLKYLQSEKRHLLI